MSSGVRYYAMILSVSLIWHLSLPALYAQAPRVRTEPKGVTPQTRTAIDRGLSYLARAQGRQGVWTNRGGFGEYPVAMTALAGLAMLMDGNTSTQGRYAPQVDRAMRFIMNSATTSGMIGRGTRESRPMYGHGFSMLFLSQAYGMEEDATRSKQLHDILRRAVTLTAKAQSRRGGWIYTPDSGGDEGSVTVTQVQALRAARNVGVSVPKKVIDDAMNYLAVSQNSDGGIRYTSSGRGPSRVPLAAAAVCCWFNAGLYENPRAKRALAFCKHNLKADQPITGHDYYAHLYYAQALYVSSDPSWDQYYAKRRDLMLGQQRQDGSWSVDAIGDVYDTAIALIILQLPYNQLPIMQQ